MFTLQVSSSKSFALSSFRAIFSVLDLMKVDMANFAVSSIRPHLMEQSVEYERKKFQELLEKQPSMFKCCGMSFCCLFFILSCCSLLHKSIIFKTKLKFSMRIVLFEDRKAQTLVLEKKV